MSGRICYIAREGGGDRISGIRIAGLRSEEIWNAPASGGDAIAVMAETGEAAQWIASHAGRHGIGLLVVDVGGGQCRWVTAPGQEPAVVAAAMAQSEEWDSTRGFSSAWGAPSIAEACVQTLGPSAPAKPRSNGKALPSATGEETEGRRLGALAIPDVSARLLVDALDGRGIGVERAVSLWHALALAWDPAAKRADVSEAIVATSAPVTAVLMVDDHRIVWSWSRAGDLLAGGTVRLATRSGAGAQVSPSDLGRLLADWISWSVQLGAAPARVIVLTPRLESANLENAAAESAPEGLGPQELGAQLGKAWPGATVDLAVHDDPLGATLARLAAIADDDAEADQERGQALVTLARRPGRSHRAMYRWSALAMIVGALALGAIAWKAWDAADDARVRAREVRAQTIETVQQVTPVNDDVQRERLKNNPADFLQTQLASKRQLLNPTGGLDPTKPILAELDALSYVLGNPDFRVTNIDLLSSGILLSVEVPDTASGEELIRSMRSVYGSSVAEWKPQWSDATGSARKNVLLQGRWAPDAGKGAP